MKNKNTIYWVFLIVIPLVFLIWYFINKHEDKPLRTLPFFGPKSALKINDTLYHKVGNFEFINQNGEHITEAFVKDKIYVADYFFTTCQSICPVMSNNLVKVYRAFEKDTSVFILSHTVDPETDTVAQMKRYALQHGVNDARWQFLTGDKKSLYEQARKSYLLNAEEGDGGADDFIHTQNFALIDKERHIRGFYDGTDSLEIQRLITEIRMLLNEYAYKARK